MNPLADQLNEQIAQENIHLYDLLSDLGKRLYFPKGILTQTAEAKQKASRYNATIGMATENDRPMYLPLIQETLAYYDPKDLYTYAPPGGKPELREAWKNKILRENPSLKGKLISKPMVTNALTHGLSIIADLFVNQDDPLIIPDKNWGNYITIFGVRRGARIVTYPFYTEQGTINISGLKQCLLSQKEHRKAILVLNFPNNPTGYTPTEAEATEIVQTVKEVAEQGLNLVVVTDDAYFGLFYENSITESLFARLADIHPRVLAVKIDGTTKEEYVWGFRVGFITYATQSQPILDALEQKTLGTIRGTISSASHPSQSFVLHALQSSEFSIQKQQKYEILKARAAKVKQVLDRGKYDDAWSYYPFNSGYFMCLKLRKVKSEQLRQHLLDQYGVGVIALGESDLRVAFSCVEEREIETLFDLIYQGVQDLTTDASAF